MIIMNSFHTSFFFFNKRFLRIPRVYRKVCDNYFFNYCGSPLLHLQSLDSKEQRREEDRQGPHSLLSSHFQFWMYEIAARQNPASLTCRYLKGLGPRGWEWSKPGPLSESVWSCLLWLFCSALLPPPRWRVTRWCSATPVLLAGGPQDHKIVWVGRCLQKLLAQGPSN